MDTIAAMEKRNITLIFIIGVILIWCAFQLAVTPWGVLSGKLIFKTNRSSEAVKGTKAQIYSKNIILKEGQTQVLGLSEHGAGLRCRWSPDGTKLACFSGDQNMIFDSEGNRLIAISKASPRMIGTYLAWFPDNQRILTVEWDQDYREQGDGKRYDYLFIYDSMEGTRELFYDKPRYRFRDIEISETGTIFFTGALIDLKDPKGKRRLHRMDPVSKEIAQLSLQASDVELINSDQMVVFYGPVHFKGMLLSTNAFGVYDLRTGFTRYIDFWAGNIKQLTAVQDGKYVVTAQGEGDAVVLYKRSLWGGLKIPVLKKEYPKHLQGQPTVDEHPDWTA